VIFLANSFAAVINYKTGFYPPTPIQNNFQMLTEGCLTALQFSGPDAITVALIHPNFSEDGKITQHHTYTRKYLLDTARPNLQRVAEQAMELDAPRSPSENNCQWCLGKKNKVCPEYLRWVKNS
jgi:hypothetical protein